MTDTPMTPQQHANFANLNRRAIVAMANKLDKDALVRGAAQAEQTKIDLAAKAKNKKKTHRKQQFNQNSQKGQGLARQRGAVSAKEIGSN